MSKRDGGPAFPVETYGDGRGLQTGPSSGWETGMSLRDYFAAKALLGILSGPASREGVQMKEWFDIPEQAYKLADAMLQARALGE